VLAVGTGAASQGNAFRFNGTSWKKENIGTTAALESVNGFSAEDIFAVGIGGGGIGTFKDSFFHFDGSEWRRSTTQSFVHFSGVWATSSSTVYVSGTGTVLYRGTLK
jgi:hypothetical protein